MTGANADVLELLLERVPEALDRDARVAELRVAVDEERLLVAVGQDVLVEKPIESE